MSRRSVLVTGAAGSLGTFLVPALKQAGWRVRALVHRRPVAAADESLRGDVRDPAAVEIALTGVDAIVHAAALTHARDVRRYADVNERGTEVVVGVARRVGVRTLLLVSSRAIAEGGGAYSDSKRRSEAIVRESGLSATVVRLPEVYGAGSLEGIDRLVASARAGRPILVVGNGSDLVSPVHAADAVSALLRALENPDAAGKTYTLAGPTLTLYEAALACRITFDSAGRIIRVPETLVRLAVRLSRVLPLPLCPDQLDRLRAVRPPPSPEAETDLGFRPRGFAEGLMLVRSGA